jgi:transcription antitermination factor NusG
MTQFFKADVTERAKPLPHPEETLTWYAVYTKPRWEKKVSQLIEKKGLEVYCPLTKVRRKWSDRYKTVEEPLFKSYVFVRIAAADKTRIRLTDGVVNFVYWLGKPAEIKPAEIELIKRFLKEFREVEARPLSLVPGDRVRIKAGVMIDLEGLVVKVLNQRAYVQLESLGYELTAQFEKRNLEPVGSMNQPVDR